MVVCVCVPEGGLRLLIKRDVILNNASVAGKGLADKVAEFLKLGQRRLRDSINGDDVARVLVEQHRLFAFLEFNARHSDGASFLGSEIQNDASPHCVRTPHPADGDANTEGHDSLGQSRRSQCVESLRAERTPCKMDSEERLESCIFLLFFEEMIPSKKTFL